VLSFSEIGVILEKLIRVAKVFDLQVGYCAAELLFNPHERIHSKLPLPPCRLNVRVLPENDSIQTRESELLNLSALRLKRVPLGPKSQFFCRQLLRVPANSGLNERTRKSERCPTIVDPAKCNVDLWMVGIAVNDSDPL
jgi:hypothetical protein